MLRSDIYRLADVLVISDFELDDFPEKTSAAISEVQSRNVRFHALQIGRGGNESTLRHFDGPLGVQPPQPSDCPARKVLFHKIARFGKITAKRECTQSDYSLF